MSIYTCELKDDQDAEGVALICSSTGLPLPISPRRFTDASDAERFLVYARDRLSVDARSLSADELAALHDRWSSGARQLDRLAEACGLELRLEDHADGFRVVGWDPASQDAGEAYAIGVVGLTDAAAVESARRELQRRSV